MYEWFYVVKNGENRRSGEIGDGDVNIDLREIVNVRNCNGGGFKCSCIFGERNTGN